MSQVADLLIFAEESDTPARPPWRVLIVDDDNEVHKVTRLVLGSFRFEQRPLELLSAHSGREAFEVLRAHDDIAVILLDVVMESEQAGLDLVKRIRDELSNAFVRIILRTGQPGQAPEQQVIADYDINDYKDKTELTAQKLATTMYAALRAYRDLRTIDAIAHENRLLQEELVASQMDMVYLLAGAAETRSQETANHVKRVGLLAEMLAREQGMHDEQAELLRYASPLHDIGKIGIPDAILNKPGAHTPEETTIMRTHAELGAQLLSGSRRPMLKLAAEIAASHHENWDGSGYPNGLSGDAIPLSGRITMVADVFDALGSRRCYKEPWPMEDIRAFMLAQRGRKFDPALVDLLFARWDQAIALRESWPD